MSTEEYHKKTILQVVPALVSGGVERGTLEIAKKVVESDINQLLYLLEARLLKFCKHPGQNI